MALATVDGDLVVTGLFYPNGGQAPIQRSALAQETYTQFEVPLFTHRIWNAVETPLTTAGSDDLGYGSGAFATGTPYVSAGALGSAGATTRYARFLYQVPANYISGQLARFQFLAGITGGTPAAASVSCTLDLEVYKVGANALITGSDLVSTSAQSINSTTFADTSMELTVTTLAPGDWLDCRVTIACNDAVATSTNCVPAYTKVSFQGATKG
jgi:hypothetical protein